MKNYYVNKTAQNNGDHEVHREDCPYMFLMKDEIYLGEFNTCIEAITKAKDYFSQVVGCQYCSNKMPLTKKISGKIIER